MKEADIDMSLKSTDIGERCILNANGWIPIVHEFSDVGPATSNDFKLFACDSRQLTGLVLQPSINGWILLDGP